MVDLVSSKQFNGNNSKSLVYNKEYYTARVRHDSLGIYVAFSVSRTPFLNAYHVRVVHARYESGRSDCRWV